MEPNWEKEEQKNTVKVQLIQCQMCCQEVEEYKMAKICLCHHIFCQLCTLEYVELKLKNFQIINCPYADCGGKLDEDSGLIVTLTESEKIKYKKIKFRKKAEQENKILCPKEDCEEGILKIKVKSNLKKVGKCEKCSNTFCIKCMLPNHKGQCQQLQQKLLGHKFTYKKCPNCNRMVERSSGCSHMTCKCKCQFCYNCGGRWSRSHICVEKPTFKMEEELQSESSFQTVAKNNDKNDSEIKEISFLPSKIKEKILSSPVFNSLKKPFLELRKIQKICFVCLGIFFYLVLALILMLWAFLSTLYILFSIVILYFVFFGLSLKDLSRARKPEIIVFILLFPIFLVCLILCPFYKMVKDIIRQQNPTRQVLLLFLTGSLKPFHFHNKFELYEIQQQKIQLKRQEIKKKEIQQIQRQKAQNKRLFQMNSEEEIKRQKKAYQQFEKKKRILQEKKERQCMRLQKIILQKQRKQQTRKDENIKSQQRRSQRIERARKRLKERKRKRRGMFSFEESEDQQKNEEKKIEKSDIDGIMEHILNYEGKQRKEETQDQIQRN